MHCGFNLNSNNTARRHTSLQQSAKLHNKFKEINAKNTVLLCCDSNLTMKCDKNYIECASDTKSLMSAETNTNISYLQLRRILV